jgi:hypothetical protein
LGALLISLQPMLKRILIIVVTLLLGGVGYFIVNRWIEDSNLNNWSFIPAHALLVYEHSNLPSTYDQIKEEPVWKNLSLIPQFLDLEAVLPRIDSVLNDSGTAASLFADAPFLSSLHRTGQNSFDFLMVLEINNMSQQGILSRVQEAYVKGGYVKKTRTYLDFSITEITRSPEEVFSYILYKNYFVGSFTAYLVEDAVRALVSIEDRSFEYNFPELFEVIKLKEDEGNLYLNLEQLEYFFTGFTKDPFNVPLGKSGYLDLHISAQDIELDGFVYSNSNDFLNQFKGISGSEFDLTEVISNDDAIITHYSFSDGQALRPQIKDYLSSNQPKILNQRKDLIAQYDFDVEHVFNLMDQELALGVRYKGDEDIKTLYLEVKDSQDAYDFFRSISERHAIRSEDTLFLETYNGYEILRLEVSEFPMALVGNHAGGFEECYFSVHRNYLIFTSSLPELKKQLNDIASENTWRKSLRKTRFLEKTNPEAGFSLYLNIPSVWPRFISNLKDPWKSIALRNDFVFKNFENISLQFSQVDEKFFTNAVIDLPNSNISGNQLLVQQNKAEFGGGLGTKPYLVRNHNGGDFEILVQDTLNHIYLVGSSFEVLWDQPINEPILGPVYQVDYYQNRKLQYAFITTSQIHLIDRNGDYLPGYPLSLPGTDQLLQFNVIDYDGSKRYRFGLTDPKGGIYLTNKSGEVLSGWDPLQFSSGFSSTPRHYRIGGTDVFVFITENGEIDLRSRRGRSYPGFPVKAGSGIVGDFFLESGSRFNQTQLTVVTTEGQLLTIDLKANVIRREQLYKPAPNTHFEIINDVGRDDFIILRKTSNQYEILDKNLNLLFQKDYLEEEGFFIQYYNLSSSKEYVVIGNPSSSFIYLYDLNGRLVTNRPIQGDRELSMIYSGNKDELLIYVTRGNQLIGYRID